MVALVTVVVTAASAEHSGGSPIYDPVILISKSGSDVLKVSSLPCSSIWISNMVGMVLMVVFRLTWQCTPNMIKASSTIL